MSAVSAEDAALAAGALAELRASVAVVASRLDTLERELTGDTQTQQELVHAVAEQRCKQAETSNQVSAIDNHCEGFSSKLDEMASDWCARYAQLELRMVSLEGSCQDAHAICSDSAYDLANLKETCNSTSSQLSNLASERHSKHCQIDSRLLCLEQSCRDLQARAIDAAERAREAAVHGLPAQAEFESQLKDLNLRVEKQSRAIDAAERER